MPCTGCHAAECTVHRVGCPVWMTDPRVHGALRCGSCGGTFNTLHGSSLCAVCYHWRRAPADKPTDEPPREG